MYLVLYIYKQILYLDTKYVIGMNLNYPPGYPKMLIFPCGQGQESNFRYCTQCIKTDFRENILIIYVWKIPSCKPLKSPKLNTYYIHPQRTARVLSAVFCLSHSNLMPTKYKLHLEKTKNCANINTNSLPRIHNGFYYQ